MPSPLSQECLGEWGSARPFFGIPDDFETALGLVAETLGSPTDRRWCLGSLAAGRELTPHQREALLASLESPGWRRRLSRRLVAGIAD